jgi:uncharacterized protein YceK
MVTDHLTEARVRYNSGQLEEACASFARALTMDPVRVCVRLISPDVEGEGWGWGTLYASSHVAQQQQRHGSLRAFSALDGMVFSLLLDTSASTVGRAARLRHEAARSQSRRG